MPDQPSTAPAGWKPIPDPTELTTQALLREVAALAEKLGLRIDGVVSTFTARIDGMDKAQTLFEAGLNRVPSDVTQQVSHLQALQDQKFSGVQTQFVERDARAAESAQAAKNAIEAALQAAKEAVAEQNRSSALAIAKSEAATDKRIDQIVIQISTATNALDGKISDIKDRLVRIEGQGLGHQETRSEGSRQNAFVVSLVGAGVALLSIALAIAAFLHSLGVK